MIFTKDSLTFETNILKRAEFEAIPITVAAALITSKTTVKAGTPIAADGTEANDATCVGLLLHDVTVKNPNGALLKKAYVNSALITASYGTAIASTAKAVLPMIVFE
jgi:hypothetical protein